MKMNEYEKGFYKELTEEEFNKYKHDDKFIHEVTFSHGVANSKGELQFTKSMTKYGIAKQDYEVNEEIINKAKQIFDYRKNKIISNIKKNTLYFIGMGMQFETEPPYLNNHRIRAYFKNNDGILCFVEFGTAINNKFLRCDHALINTKKEWNSLKEREQEKRINELESIKGDYNKYTKEEVLKLVNLFFNCNFNDLEILEYFVSCDDITSISGAV